MLKSMSPVELIVILLIVVLLFGAGRIGRLGKEMGSAVSEFRKGVKQGSEEEKKDSDSENSTQAES